jgi:hypothetical protein
MGWVESAMYFCAVLETARDVATDYIETKVGSLPQHNFTQYLMNNNTVKALPKTGIKSEFHYFLDIYVNDFIPMAVATSQEQLEHVATAIMHGIHDVFPANNIDEEDPISLKGLKQLEGQWALQKDILGFTFDGDKKTMVLEEPKCKFLLTILHKWVCAGTEGGAGIPFAEFESVVQNICHAFTAIPVGKGLLTSCKALLQKRPAFVFLAQSKPLLQAISDYRTLLHEAIQEPTKCMDLVLGESDFIGVKDASIEGVGGIIIGKKSECIPTVFHLPWSDGIKGEVQKTNAGQGGKISNSNLEMAGLLLLFLVMEEVCNFKPGAHVALFSNNSPTVN